MRTRSKRNSNKKTIASAGLLALAAISVFSVGFASWIIGSETTGTTGNFEVNVETVTDSRVQIKGAAMTDAKLVFGPFEENTGLITAKAADATEDLQIQFTITADKTEATSDNFQGFQFNFADDNGEEATNNISEYLAAETTKDYIVWPGVYGSYIALVDDEWNAIGTTYYAKFDGENVTALADNTNGSASWSVSVTNPDAGSNIVFTVTLYVKWGSYFGNMNPVHESYTHSSFTGVTDDNAKATAFKQALQSLATINSAKSVINVKHPTSPIEIA